MDEAIIASAKKIILKQRRDSEEKTADEAIEALQQRMEDRMSELDKKLDAIMARFPTA